MFEVPGPVMMDNAAAMMAEGAVAIAGGETEISLARMSGSDSSALSVLLAWQRAARAAEVTLIYRDIPDPVKSFANLYGIEAFLPGFHDAASIPASSPAPTSH